MTTVAYISQHYVYKLVYNISAYAAQNTIHLEYNICILIFDKISTETVASMLVTVLQSYAYAIWS